MKKKLSPSQIKRNFNRKSEFEKKKEFEIKDEEFEEKKVKIEIKDSESQTESEVIIEKRDKGTETNCVIQESVGVNTNEVEIDSFENELELMEMGKFTLEELNS